MKQRHKEPMPTFICLEGIAGSGKTTQSLLLKEKIEKEGWGEVLISKAYERERKETADSFARDLHLEPTSIGMMFLFQALHSLQYQEVKQALEEGKIVIADRWREAFWAYHLYFGFLSTQPRRVLETLDRLAFQFLNPQITFLFDLSVEEAIRRLSSRDSNNRQIPLYPQDGAEKHFRIMRNYYLGQARKKKWMIINADGSVRQVHKNIWRILLPILKERSRPQ